ncbi:MAG TPA: D-hexose-6-phosphate mutarotase [Candidatus Sulfotelmatobacter sp.]|jgi:glucose-6-phosphate 1-epimerase|nr:D-hexose-6-phosphate mutarotase [Candidatus Sulfotelmatobacter sp.]
MEGAIAELDYRFGIPGIAQVVEGNGGLPKVRVTSPEAIGEMYLHGAHVTSWKPATTEEVLFLSSQSRWEQGHAIRGGVPICFPWFGGKADDPHAPAHGFVRTKAWQLESITQAGDGVTVSMFTESNEDTKRWWPAEFRLAHRVTFGAELRHELVVTNVGRTSLRFEEALHAYYRVGNVEKTGVRGLDAVHYFDKTDSNREKLQQGEIAIVSETDRVYLNTRDAIEMGDPVLGRRILVTKENSRTTVVWDPWVQKAHLLSDFADDEWKQMICVETSNVSDFAVDLAPGQQHKIKALVRVADF